MGIGISSPTSLIDDLSTFAKSGNWGSYEVLAPGFEMPILVADLKEGVEGLRSMLQSENLSSSVRTQIDEALSLIEANISHSTARIHSTMSPRSRLP